MRLIYTASVAHSAAHYAAIVLASVLMSTVVAQTDTTLTYQGELRQSGSPLNGTADLRFTLRIPGGSSIGPPQTITNVPVSDGRFSVELDFGSNAFNLFNASPRELQIEVRSPAGSGAYTTLTPNQPITRAPYAIQTRGLYADDDLNVGIGTSVPHAPLHVREGQSGTNGQPSSSAIFERSSHNYVSILSPSGTERGVLFGDETSVANGGIVFNNSSTPDGLEFRTGGNATRMFLKSDGRLGVGTSSTIGQLSVLSSTAPFAVDASSSSSSFPTVFAANTGNGPALWAQGNIDTKLSGGGIIVAGPETSANISIDQNEIMARNNGQTSPLFLNADGGEVRMGEHGIKPALAYGRVSSGGGLISGSPNITSVQRTSEGRYQIGIEGGVTTSDVIFATAISDIHSAGAGSVSGVSTMFVVTRDILNNESSDASFSFIVYRP